jgi:hypothetical protein
MDKRIYRMISLNDHPVLIRKQDGTKLRCFVNNISFGGLQFRYSRITAHILSSKSGILKKDIAPKIEITMTIPVKNEILEINAVCKLVYVAIDNSG